jgi:hypothetical protein
MQVFWSNTGVSCARERGVAVVVKASVGYMPGKTFGETAAWGLGGASEVDNLIGTQGTRQHGRGACAVFDTASVVFS